MQHPGTYTLFELLSMDERIIVYSSEEDKQLYTWNQSATIACWNVKDDGTFTEEAIINRYDVKSYAYARTKAIEWHTSWFESKPA